VCQGQREPEYGVIAPADRRRITYWWGLFNSSSFLNIEKSTAPHLGEVGEVG
jgi:hypothetical protein